MSVEVKTLPARTSAIQNDDAPAYPPQGSLWVSVTATVCSGCAAWPAPPRRLILADVPGMTVIKCSLGAHAGDPRYHEGRTLCVAPVREGGAAHPVLRGCPACRVKWPSPGHHVRLHADSCLSKSRADGCFYVMAIAQPAHCPALMQLVPGADQADQHSSPMCCRDSDPEHKRAKM